MANKKHLLIQVFLILGVVAVVGAGFLLLEKNSPTVASFTSTLKPEHFETKKFSQVEPISTSAANPRIEEQILGSKASVSSLVTYKGNDLLVLVNKKISLPKDFAPADLVGIGGFILAPPGASLRRETAQALSEMKVAALSSGAKLSVVSAYRSYSQQVATFNGWVSSAGLKNAESFSARPGHSQHQLGTAIDFGAEGRTDFSESFGQTTEGVWLSQNAYKYGFVLSYPKGKETITGYAYEPWHYRYIGVDNAAKMTASGKTLEEYLQTFGTW